MRRAAFLLLALVALSALAPLAGADHVYSHRYLFVGRVIDAAGHPVPNVTVQVALDEQLPVEGACGTQPRTETDAWGATVMRPVTNALGEFMFCYHVHVVPSNPPPQATLSVQGEGGSVAIPMDADFRASYVVLRGPSGNASSANVATLAGRVWEPKAGATLEGVPVNGLTVNLAPVNVTFTHDGVAETLHARTNNYGDFALHVNGTAPFGNGTMEVETMGKRFSAPYHADQGAAYLKADISSPGASDALIPAPTPSRAAPEPVKAAPGLGLVGALVALALAARLQTRGGA